MLGLVSADVSAQTDPGLPDTLRIDSLNAPPGGATGLSVFFANDQALSGIEITVLPSDTLVRADSFSFVGGRVDYIATKGWVVNDSTGALTAYCLPVEEPLVPIGTGLLGTLHVSYPLISPPVEVTIDSTTVEIDLIVRSTQFRDSVGVVFTPQFVPGYLFIDEVFCCFNRTGNVNFDTGNNVDLPDVIYLVNALFLGGPPPPCPAAANVNGDDQCAVDLPDVIYLVNALFLGGPAPAACLAECE
jgi:hypothetical protein